MSRDVPTEDRERHCHKRAVGLRGRDASDTLAHGLTCMPAPGILKTLQLLPVRNKDKLNARALAALRTMMVTQALPY
ncbi:MAG TPA: hypothetical protein VFX24_02145 [Ktedonobacterales bacterium]|nr:hypothetical protein [Ktedonobacterales bacterium]